MDEVKTMFAAIDLVRSFLNKKQNTAIMEKYNKLLSMLISIQEMQIRSRQQISKLKNKNFELEIKLMEYDNWSKEIESHELKEIRPGLFVYVIKDPKNDIGKQICYCANCFDNRKKSILQHEINTWYKCHRCNYQIQLGKPRGGISFG
jgi:hypothetical protein